MIKSNIYGIPSMIYIFIDYKLEKFKNEINYTYGFIFQTLGYSFSFVSDIGELKEDDILFIYGYTDPTIEELVAIAQHFITIFIPCEPDLFDPKSMTMDKLKRNLKMVKLLSKTPVISSRSFSYPAENYSESKIQAGKINFDLVGNIFFHLAHLESQVDSTRDAEGYYPEEASIFHPYRETPYVDNMLWLVDSMIKEHTRSKGIPLVQKQYWPQGQEGAALLTHSVDNLQKWNYTDLLLSLGTDVAMFFTLNWKQLFHTISSKFKYLFTNVELYWNFEEYRALEEASGYRSTFYIAPDKNEYINYSLDDPDLQEEIRQLTRTGNEIGLLLTPDKTNPDDYITRKQVMLHQLHQETIGIRQLHYKINENLRGLHSKLNPAYSQSTALRDMPGYINGVTVPYQPWIGGLSVPWYELPTIYCDAHLRVGRFKTLQLEPAKKLLKKFFQSTIRTRGVFGLDLNLASYYDIPYVKKLYTYALALIKSGGIWVPTANELSLWWNKRNRVTINETEYEISIFFPDNLENFTLKIINIKNIKEILGVPAKVEGNMVSFSNVNADSIAVIRLNQEL
ncbi:MAG TPA: hypothetical protein PK187_05575 [Candidatus Syntrophosphaera thermopropionivorans]|jgi:hypothetical protein|nr:hypothetical protein [Candidatus Syntrophosphaera thermopropionivorans]